MDKNTFNKTSFISAIIISILALIMFLINTGMFASSMLMILVSLFVIFPFRKDSVISNRILILSSILFVGWLMQEMGTALMPFFVSMFTAYLLDPIVSFGERRKIPRWLSSILIILLLVGIVSAVAVFVFPIIFQQLDNVIKSINGYANQATRYVESDSFYRTLSKFGIPKSSVKSVIEQEFLPKIENIASKVFTAFLSLLNSLSGVATQLINAVIMPILTFYLLKDFSKLKELISSVLQVKNKKLLYDIKRINKIVKKYLGWQFIASIIVSVSASSIYAYFGLPYPIVIGILAGIVNPIPYLSTVISCAIGILTIILVNEGNIMSQIFVVLGTINGLHFINAYLLEPNIAGKQVGVHPALLILSIYVFSSLFGLIGLLIAVPTTATLMLFFNDWRESNTNPKTEDHI